LHCIAVGAHASVSTSDGGATWTLHSVTDASSSLLGVACASATDCVADGVSPQRTGPYAGKLFVSADAGSTWTAASLPTDTPGLGGLACPTATRCIAVGDAVVVSDDGGQTWQQETVPGGMGSLRSITCTTTLYCIAVGPNAQGGIDPNAPANAVVTTDGGNTWRHASLPSGSAALEQISCGSTQSCVAAGPSLANGGAPTFVSTNNGGAKWLPETVPPGMVAIADVACTADSHCAAVGRTTTGSATAVTSDGSTWTVQAAVPS